MAQARPNASGRADYARARQAMRAFDYEAALPLLQRALHGNELLGRERANAYVDLGLTHFNLGQTDAARAAFRQALELDAEVTLPPRTAPKIHRLFESAKPEPAPPPAAVVPPATPTPQLAPAPPAPALSVSPALRPQPAPRPTKTTWAVSGALVGVAAVTAGVGIYAALDTHATATQLAGGLHTQQEATRLLHREQVMQAVAYAGYATAGGAGIAAALTFFLIPRSSNGPTVSLIPSPFGLAAMTGMSF